MMLEGRAGVFMIVRQRYPCLDAEQLVRLGARLSAGALGMRHAVPGDHPVDLARVDHLVGAERVPVLEPAAIEIGHGRQPDMRMRAHVDTVPGQEVRRPHLVEEDERPHHLPLWRWQSAAHLEAAEITGARDDDGLDPVEVVSRRADGFKGRVPAHVVLQRGGSCECRRDPRDSLPALLAGPVIPPAAERRAHHR